MSKFEHTDEHAKDVHRPRPPKSRRMFRVLGGVAATVIIIALVPTSLAFGYDRYFANRIFPSVAVFGIKVSGLTRAEATSLLRRRTNELLESGLSFSLNANRFTISKTQIDGSQLVRFDIDGAVAEAFNVGREGDVFRQNIDRYQTILAGRRLELDIEVDEQTIAELVTKEFAEEVHEAKNASPLVKIDATGEVQSIGIAAAESGSSPRFIEAVRNIRPKLSDDKNPTFVIPVDIIEPSIRVSDAEPHLAELSTLLIPRELRLVHDKGGWTLTRRDIANALAFIKTEDGIQASIDPKKLTNFFKPIRKAIEIPAVNAIFTMKEDKVVEFKPHKQGIGIDEVAFASTVRDALYQSKAGIEIPMTKTEPEITTEKSNTLGIKEALGTGTSNYKGSPANRVKNILNGVNHLDLSLIPPGGEFSLVSALKPFDAMGGYVPELVIKGSKLEPEIGGGLCQIGTTTFRAVMNSGLPITMRQNHSLVVSYYNDPANGNPGSDATIYDPSPDFKFKNDTENYLLIAADAPGNFSLRFTIYGTSDGRKGSYQPPTVSKWTPVPKETKTLYLESSSVNSGEQKCKAGFPGAVASLRYSIERPDGVIDERIFTSIYRMLPPVCLVAKGEIPVEDPATAVPSPAVDLPIPAADAGDVTQ